MLDHDASRLALERLFAHRPVADLPRLSRALGTRSRMSVFRRLSTLGYRSSYTHTGRYYTLRSIPQFDTDGLWRIEGAGFSRDGTLKATVCRLVEIAEAGRTQRELQMRLGVRVHNPRSTWSKAGSYAVSRSWTSTSTSPRRGRMQPSSSRGAGRCRRRPWRRRLRSRCCWR